MKKTVNVYLNIKSSTNFERKIYSYFQKKSEIVINEIILFSHSGYGQYKDYLHFSIDGKDIKIHKYHTNSIQKDWYKSDEFDNLSTRSQDNFIKSKVLGILESNRNLIIDINV